MNCTSGHPNPDSAAFCTTCGLALGSPPPMAPPPSPAVAPPVTWPTSSATISPASWSSVPPQPVTSPQNGMGTAALVLGLIGLPFGCIFGILAIIFGAVGMQRANAGLATNRGVAMAGLVIGIVGTVIWTLVGLASL